MQLTCRLQCVLKLCALLQVGHEKHAQRISSSNLALRAVYKLACGFKGAHFLESTHMRLRTLGPALISSTK